LGRGSSVAKNQSIFLLKSRGLSRGVCACAVVVCVVKGVVIAGVVVDRLRPLRRPGRRGLPFRLGFFVVEGDIVVEVCGDIAGSTNDVFVWVVMLVLIDDSTFSEPLLPNITSFRDVDAGASVGKVVLNIVDVVTEKLTEDTVDERASSFLSDLLGVN
jgi:hypothetical protein